MLFDKMQYEIDARGRIIAERVVGEQFFPADDVILAIGQENAFPWIENDLGLEFDKWHVPVVDEKTHQSTRPDVFFGGDAAFGPKNIIWAVEHGHQAAISIHNFCMDQPVTNRLPPTMNLSSRKMGLHEWSYKNDYNPVERRLVPHVSLKERFKQISIEVELGFDPEQAAAEVQRCLNCDIQTVFEAKLCIECDACIDICPTDCLTITTNGDEAELVDAPQGAAQQPAPAAVRLRALEADRPRHGQGRGPLRALRTLRRALPDGGLGHAEVHDPPAPRDRPHMAQPAKAQDRVNDFVIKLANVNGTGSASANTLLMKSIFRMGIPVMGKNYFPSNIQGLPTWYEIRVTRDGYVARSGRVDLMVAMNAETYAKDVREVSAGGYLIYDSTWPRSTVLKREDITILGVPLAKICNENFVGVRNRILMKNIMYAGVLAALLEIDLDVFRQLLTESFGKKQALVDANMKAVQLGYDYAKEHLPCPLPLRARAHGQDGRPHHDRRQHGGGPRCRVRGRDRRPVVPDHAVHVADGRVQELLRQAARRSRDRQEQLRRDPGRGRAVGDRHGARRIVERRARVHGHERPRHLADERVHRARLLRRGSGGDLRRAARRPLDRHADAHAAVRHPALRLCLARRHQARAAVPVEPGRVLLHGDPGVRPGRAPADAGVRDVGPRHRHERLDVPANSSGTTAIARTAARC